MCIETEGEELIFGKNAKHAVTKWVTSHLTNIGSNVLSCADSIVCTLLPYYSNIMLFTMVNNKSLAA